MRAWAFRQLRRADSFLAARGVARESLTLAAALVSITAGLVLAAGGAAGEPRLWLVVPPLGLFRLAIDALVDCRRQSSDREERPWATGSGT